MDGALERRRLTSASDEELTRRGDDVTRDMGPQARLTGSTYIKIVVGGIIRKDNEQVVVARGERSPFGPAPEKVHGEGMLHSDNVLQEASEALVC